MELDNRLSGRLQNNNDHDMRVTNYVHHNHPPTLKVLDIHQNVSNNIEFEYCIHLHLHCFFYSVYGL